MTEGNELVPIDQIRRPKKNLMDSLRERVSARDEFNWQRWIDPQKPDHYTRDHTLYVQHQAYEVMQMYKAKGYGALPDIDGAIHHMSDQILINEHFLGKYKKEDDAWRDKEGRAVGISEAELMALEAEIVSLDPEIRKLTQDRIVARYFLLRNALMTAVFTKEVYGGEDEAPMPVYRIQNPYMVEVSLMMKNPKLVKLFATAAVARETQGDAIKLYDPNYKENEMDSPRHIAGHTMAVRRELVEKIPPLSKVVLPLRREYAAGPTLIEE